MTLKNTKLGSAVAVAASLVIAGTIATASAAPDNNAGDSSRHNSGYTAEQCKDGGWRNFKNPDGSQKFKNQGQCVAFFTGHHQPPGGHNFFAALWSLFLSFISWWGNLFGSILRA